MPSTTTMSQEIALIGGSLAVRQSKGALTGNWEYYPLCNIVSVVAPVAQIGFAARDISTNQKAHRYGPDDMFRVVVEFNGRIQRQFDFDLAHVTNQAGWTLDAAGLQQAVDDINQWIADCCCAVPVGGPDGGASEATLVALDSAVDGLLSNSNDVSDEDNDAITAFLLNKIGGKAVDTATYSPGYTANDAAMSAVDKDNGGILVNQANLAIDEDEVLNHPGAIASNFGMPDKFINEDVDETGAVSVKAGAGNVYGWNVINGGNQPVYLKFYNEASGSVIVGTTDVEMIVMIPANGSVYQSPDNRKLYCDSEISVAATGGQADNDTTATSGTLRVEIDYK